MTSTLSSKPSTEVTPIRRLLASVVDYAGLFPPAGHTTEAAASAYHRYRQEKHAWMLGAFVVPAAGVDDLAEAVGPLEPPTPWPLSVIVDSAEQGLDLVQRVKTRHAGSLSVQALEVRPREPAEIRGGLETLAELVARGVHVYQEVPLDGRTAERLDAVAAVGARAKVRTGGVTAAAFPTAEAVVEFLGACAERDLTLKATAGLHHAFPGSYPLTYEAGSACGVMHGFLGLALVATLVHHQAVDAGEAVVLLAGGAEALEVRDDALVWHGRRVGADEISAARGFFVSFGSCSFEEPVAELEAASLI